MSMRQWADAAVVSKLNRHSARLSPYGLSGYGAIDTADCHADYSTNWDFDLSAGTCVRHVWKLPMADYLPLIGSLKWKK
jgi:hypothetical protein